MVNLPVQLLIISWTLPKPRTPQIPNEAVEAWITPPPPANPCPPPPQIPNEAMEAWINDGDEDVLDEAG